MHETNFLIQGSLKVQNESFSNFIFSKEYNKIFKIAPFPQSLSFVQKSKIIPILVFVSVWFVVSRIYTFWEIIYNIAERIIVDLKVF